MKVVYDSHRGGIFKLSEEAAALYESRGGKEDLEDPFEGDIRTDPIFIQIVEELGAKASGRSTSFKIAEIPDKYSQTFEIDDENGEEKVVCDNAKLVAYCLKNLDIPSLSDEELRTVMTRYKEIAEEPSHKYV